MAVDLEEVQSSELDSSLAVILGLVLYVDRLKLSDLNCELEVFALVLVQVAVRAPALAGTDIH